MSSLWRGEDHLVYVRGSGFVFSFTEEYKRYRFDDIQAVAISKRSQWPMGLVFGFGFLGCLLIVALILAFADRESLGVGTATFLSIFAVSGLVSLSFLVRHLILGPPCFCDLQTSLSRDRIRPLNRVPIAKEVLLGLDDQIREGQDSLLEETDTERISTGEMTSRAQEQRWTVPWPVLPTFGIATFFGVVAIAAMHLESLALVGLLLVTFLIFCLSLILSLVTSIRNATPQSIRSCSWALLGVIFFFSGISIVYLFLSAAKDPVYTVEITGPLEAFLAISSENGYGFYFLFVGALFLVSICGLIGLSLAMRWRKRIAGMSPPAPSAEAELPAVSEEKEEADG